LTSLADLPVGTAGHVLQVDGVDEISIRLLEMGLTPGVSFRILGVAPLGDPLELEIRGYHLSIRKSEARRVQVQVPA
jgi:Fe2+ transport system protein FeoA